MPLRGFGPALANRTISNHKEATMRTFLLFLMGVPIPILILYNILY